MFVIEIQVKLRMTLEQELVRLFGNFARKTAGCQVPYSACSVITSQMRPVGVKVSCAKASVSYKYFGKIPDNWGFCCFPDFADL